MTPRSPEDASSPSTDLPLWPAQPTSPSAARCRGAASLQGRRDSSAGASRLPGPLERLRVLCKNPPEFPGGGGGAEALSFGGPGAPARPSRRASTTLLPRLSSAGTLQPLAGTSRRRSVHDVLVAAQPAVGQALSRAGGRRRSVGVLHQEGVPQAERQDCLVSQPQLLQRRGGGEELQARRGSWSEPVRRLPRPEPGAERSSADFAGPHQRRATLGAAGKLAALAKLVQEEGFGGDPDEESHGGPSPTTLESLEECSSTSASDDGQVAPAVLEVHVPLGATLLEIYSGYADEGAEVHDRFTLLAFKRFASPGTNEIARDRLHDALVHVGFMTSTREQALDLATKLSKFHNFDYMDFCEYVSRFAALERAAVRRRADACVAERSSHAGAAAALEQTQQFLRSAGVCLPYSSVESARQAAQLDHVSPEDMSTNDLLLTLASCRVDEGFTKEEVAAAHQVFSELEQDQRDPPGGWGPVAKASMLLEGLLQFTGLYSVDYMDSLADILPSDSAEQQSVCFHEFLIWARRLRDPMMQDLWKCFNDFDTSGSGLIQLDTAISIAAKFGITLLTDALDELVSDLDLQNASALTFDTVVRFMCAARKMHGFSRSEREDFSAAFQKFNYHGTGELTHLQVLELLRHLGNTTSVDEVSSLIKRVDFNKNGSMDRHEFLRLMRFMREQDIRGARKAFDKLRSPTGQMPIGSVKDALAKLQLFPQDNVLAELLQDMPAEVCFTSFMHINDRCRFRMNLEFRMRAGFQESTIAEIAKFWHGGDSPRRFATIGELIWMFTGSHEIPVNTSTSRQDLLKRMRFATGAAVAAGVPEEEASRERSTDIGFYTFVHLVRGFVRDSEQEVIDREKEAVSFARFPTGEVAELRRVFSDLAEREAKSSSVCKQPAGRGHSVDKLLARLTRVPSIPETALPLLLKSIGLWVPLSKLHDLSRFLAETRSRGEADESTIQFATFLRLFRWMFDIDFAGIRSVLDFQEGDRAEGVGSA